MFAAFQEVRRGKKMSKKYIKVKDRKSQTPEKSGVEGCTVSGASERRMAAQIAKEAKEKKSKIAKKIKENLQEDSRKIVEKIEPTYRKTQVAPTSQITEGQEYVQTIGGERLTFVFSGGELKLIKQESLNKDGKRYFRLKPMPLAAKKHQANKRYFINPGSGQKILRFWQANFEGEKRDPKKETIREIKDKDMVRRLSSMPGIFEGVYDYVPSKKEKETP